MREIKANESSRQKAGYNSPSVRVVDVKMKNGIMLNVSTPPTDMDPMTPVFRFRRTNEKCNNNQKKRKEIKT